MSRVRSLRRRSALQRSDEPLQQPHDDRKAHAHERPDPDGDGEEDRGGDEERGAGGDAGCDGHEHAGGSSGVRGRHADQLTALARAAEAGRSEDPRRELKAEPVCAALQSDREEPVTHRHEVESTANTATRTASHRPRAAASPVTTARSMMAPATTGTITSPT